MSLQRECQARVSNKSCQARVSHKSRVSHTCVPARVPHKGMPQELSSKSVPHDCPRRVSSQARVFCKSRFYCDRASPVRFSLFRRNPSSTWALKKNIRVRGFHQAFSCNLSVPAVTVTIALSMPTRAFSTASRTVRTTLHLVSNKFLCSLLYTLLYSFAICLNVCQRNYKSSKDE